MQDEPISINSMKVSFDSAKAFEGIASSVVIEVPESLHGCLHPMEVLNAARECLIQAFKTVVDHMNDQDILKHIEIFLVASTDLHKLIKKSDDLETSKDIH